MKLLPHTDAWTILPQSTYERAGAIGGGVIAILGSLLGEHGPELVVWILLAMGFDLLTGLIRALILPNDIEQVEGAKFARGVLKKLLLLCLLFPAAMVDRLANLTGVIAESAGAITFAVMIGICMYEGASIVKNIRTVTGESAMTVGLIRLIDVIRYGGEPPERRHYDPKPDPEEGP